MSKTTCNVAVIYYSSTGNVAAMAEALGEGAASAGAQVRVRCVAELAPPEAIAYNPKWAEFVKVNAKEPVPLSTILLGLMPLPSARLRALAAPRVR